MSDKYLLQRKSYHFTLSREGIKVCVVGGVDQYRGTLGEKFVKVNFKETMEVYRFIVH